MNSRDEFEGRAAEVLQYPCDPEAPKNGKQHGGEGGEPIRSGAEGPATATGKPTRAGGRGRLLAGEAARI